MIDQETLGASIAYTKAHGGGGGGGTDNYNLLKNLPQINGTTLKGNKTATDFGLSSVAANPTGEATGELTSIDINGSKYSIPESVPTFHGKASVWYALPVSEKIKYTLAVLDDDYVAEDKVPLTRGSKEYIESDGWYVVHDGIVTVHMHFIWSTTSIMLFDMLPAMESSTEVVLFDFPEGVIKMLPNGGDHVSIHAIISQWPYSNREYNLSFSYVAKTGG